MRHSKPSGLWARIFDPEICKLLNINSGATFPVLENFWMKEGWAVKVYDKYKDDPSYGRPKEHWSEILKPGEYELSAFVWAHYQPDPNAYPEEN